MSAVWRWKVVTAIFGLICIALTYRVFDQGITRTYINASQESSIRHIKLLTGLIEHQWIGLPEEQIMSRLKVYVNSRPLDAIVLKHESETNTIYLEGIQFEFHDGKLVRVE